MTPTADARSPHGRVIHTGQAVVDLVLSIPAVPEPGGDVFASSHRFLAGGGFNVMAAAARDGAEVVATSGHGTGPFGDIVRSAMGAEGIEVLAPQDRDRDTGFSIALVDESAERTFVSTRGAEARLDPTLLHSARPLAGDVVYVSGYSMVHEANRDALVEWLPTLDPAVTVVVDPSPVIGTIGENALSVLIARADVWSTNLREASVMAERRHIAGHDNATGDRRALALALASQLHCDLVLRAGAEGSLLARRDGTDSSLPAPRVEAVDTNGAGDAHTGVLCAQLAKGQGLEEAVARAGAAAALAVTREGPATAPMAGETDRFLARRK